jgi:MoxR-like ATPase
MIFDSTNTYISTDELSMAVDAAVKLERPLLVKGEPGTGKTLLAEEIAKTLGMELIHYQGPTGFV